MLPNEPAVVKALPPQSCVIWGWPSGGCGAWGMQWEVENIAEAQGLPQSQLAWGCLSTFKRCFSTFQ